MRGANGTVIREFFLNKVSWKDHLKIDNFFLTCHLQIKQLTVHLKQIEIATKARDRTSKLKNR